MLNIANIGSWSVQVGQFSTGGVGQFYSGANIIETYRVLFGEKIREKNRFSHGRGFAPTRHCYVRRDGERSEARRQQALDLCLV